MFRVGQKVVCVDDTPYFANYPTTLEIAVGRVYEIRGLYRRRNGEELLRLAGVYRQDALDRVGDQGFLAWRFRPVVSRPTDISVFTKMLTDERLPDLVVLQRVLERVK